MDTGQGQGPDMDKVIIRPLLIRATPPLVESTPQDTIRREIIILAAVPLLKATTDTDKPTTPILTATEIKINNTAPFPLISYKC